MITQILCLGLAPIAKQTGAFGYVLNQLSAIGYRFVEQFLMIVREHKKRFVKQAVTFVF